MWKIGTKEIAAASMLGALSALLEIQTGLPFDIPYPVYPRITWDFVGIPIMISMFLCGPLCSVYTCVIGCLPIFFRNSFSGTLKLIAELSTLMGFVLFRKKIFIGWASAVTSRIVVMTIANYFLLQAFFKVPEPIVVGLLAPIALFNLTQALINIIPAYVVYLRIPEKLKVQVKV